MKHIGERRASRISSGGFTLVELIITMFISVLAFAIATNIFTALLTQFKQQGKIAETNIEGAVGLEILRRDIESAGYGLPTSYSEAITYTEAPDPGGDPLSNPASELNNPSNGVPEPVGSVNDSGDTLNDSDYLVIKSLSVARNSACEKSNSMRQEVDPRDWAGSPENFLSDDRVIVINPHIAGGVQEMTLWVVGGAYSTTFGTAATAGGPWRPPDLAGTHLIYGVDPAAPLQFPFNRADYYVSASGTPSHCAPNTGTLFKRVLLHTDPPALGAPIPLLDCVADMEVLYGLDNTEPPDGIIDYKWPILAKADGVTDYTAADIRTRVKEVQVQILAHEGQRDPNYSHPFSNVWVGDENFDLATTIGSPIYQNYKWKVYKIYVRPPNFGG